jgi:phosphate:Na+ symporter
MGENIGTTVTSNIVAMSAGKQARRAAFAHMFFNIFGVCWVLLLFRPFVDMVCGLVGYDVAMTKETAGQAAFLANAAKLSFVLAAFHTCFNLINTGILIWFIPQIERLVCHVIKQEKADEEEDFRLQYISAGIMKTPEISVLQAQKEITLFGERMQRMFGMSCDLLAERNKEKFEKIFERIAKYEGISDNMELEIANYLEQVSDAHLSDETKWKIRLMLRQVSELESIGDSCYNLARTMKRRMQSKSDFTEKQYEQIHSMMKLTDESLTQMNHVIEGRREEQHIEDTYNIENQINELRNKLKADNIQAINDHEYDYAIGTMYIDLVSECEKLGDYVVNVVQAKLGA